MLDALLGCAILHRRTLDAAALAMIAVTAVYPSVRDHRAAGTVG